MWPLAACAALVSLLLLVGFSLVVTAGKLMVAVDALRQIAGGHLLFPKAVARAALRDVGELDEEPDA